MGISSIDRATENLVKWASRGEWEPLQEEFYGSHLEPVIDGAREQQATAPVTREMAREVMVRTPLFARTLSQLWVFDAAMQAQAPAPELRNTDDEAILDDHYRRTLDDPLPMLDGKTLREVARTRTGRPQVIDWLKELENIEHRRAAHEGHMPYDTAWLWRELGIEVPR